MYILDFTSLQKRPTKMERDFMRRSLRRNHVMTYKLKLQHDQCFYCGADITMQDHLDHLLPVCYGGTNNLSNLVAACKSCNMTKGSGYLEITNPYTIKDYLKLQSAHAAWERKYQRNPKNRRRSQPKRVALYGVYRARYFKEI